MGRGSFLRFIKAVLHICLRYKLYVVTKFFVGVFISTVFVMLNIVCVFFYRKGYDVKLISNLSLSYKRIISNGNGLINPYNKVTGCLYRRISLFAELIWFPFKG